MCRASRTRENARECRSQRKLLKLLSVFVFHVCVCVKCLDRFVSVCTEFFFAYSSAKWKNSDVIIFFIVLRRFVFWRERWCKYFWELNNKFWACTTIVVMKFLVWCIMPLRQLCLLSLIPAMIKLESGKQISSHIFFYC